MSSRNAAALALLLVGCLFAASCGDEENPRDPCDGCFLSGYCFPGDEISACGANGADCTACQVGQNCRSGKCMSSCTGCQDIGGNCLPGNTEASCGSLGAACQACRAGQQCLAGTCQQLCNGANCPNGCCGAGGCQTTISAAACGGQGSACQVCEPGDDCLQGECADPSVGCNGCQGCCSLGDDTCLSGDTIVACGKGGANCVACPSGYICTEGTCKPNPSPCDATTCPQGCCSPSGACLGFSQQSQLSCGTSGNVCSVCASGTAVCLQGTCVEDQPCFSYCKLGCCTAQGQCKSYLEQDQSSCGDSGDPCAACETEKNCFSGSCVNDPVWDLWGLSAVIASTKTGGGNWDSWPQNPLPDPYLAICLGSPSVCWASFSKNIDNTLTPNWNQKIASWSETDLISKGVTISVLDDDNLGNLLNDEIGRCFVSITSSALQAGTLTVNSCGAASQLKLKFVQQ